jgi:hypothetical protein
MHVNVQLGRISQATGVGLAFVYLLLGKQPIKKNKKNTNTKLLINTALVPNLFLFNFDVKLWAYATKILKNKRELRKKL